MRFWRERDRFLLHPLAVLRPRRLRPPLKKMPRSPLRKRQKQPPKKQKKLKKAVLDPQPIAVATQGPADAAVALRVEPGSWDDTFRVKEFASFSERVSQLRPADVAARRRWRGRPKCSRTPSGERRKMR